MGVYKLSTAGGLATPRTNYSSFLAGNPKVIADAYESISTVTVGAGGSASVTFSSIPATYTHLQIRALLRNSGTSNNTYTANMQFNSDTATNYSAHYLNGNGTAASAGASTSSSSFYTGLTVDSSTSTLGWGVTVIDILDYANTNKYKTVRSLTGTDLNGSGQVSLYSGNWRSTSAVNAISLSFSANNFSQYSQFALYGIRGA